MILFQWTFSITPILTVFFPGYDTGLVTQQEAQLSCLKIVDLYRAEEEIMNSGGENMLADCWEATLRFWLV
jgi:hypothetical protein